MKGHRWNRALGLLLILGWLPPAAADTILLRNGNRIQGEIIEESSQGITLKFFGGTLHLKLRDVLSVERESRLQYLLDQGETFLRQGEEGLAVEAYRKACQANADSEPARKGLLASLERGAEAFSTRGLYSKSIAAWRELLKEVPDHPRAAPAIDRLEAILKEGEEEAKAAALSLKSGQVEQAADRLRALYQRFPERQAEIGPILAQALAEKAQRLLSAQQFDRADDAFLEALSLQPDLLPQISFHFAWARALRLQPLFRSGDLPGLLAGAEEGLQVAPGSEVLCYLAGVAQEGLGRRREATENYRIAAGYPRDTSKTLDFLRKVAEEKFSSPEIVERSQPQPTRDRVLPGNFREIETAHFVVSHRNDEVGNEVSKAAEAAYQRMKTDLSLKGDWKWRCSILIYPSKEEFMKLPNHAGWTGGFYEPRAHQIACYQTDPRLASATIPHEIGHAMLYLALDNNTRIPLWLNEGFAMHWEPEFSHRYHARVLDQAVRNGASIHFPQLTTMTTYPPEEGTAQVFYSECHFLVELLIEERGLEVLARFAKDLCERPNSLDELLMSYYRIRGVRGLENRLSGKLSG